MTTIEPILLAMGMECSGILKACLGHLSKSSTEKRARRPLWWRHWSDEKFVVTTGLLFTWQMKECSGKQPLLVSSPEVHAGWCPEIVSIIRALKSWAYLKVIWKQGPDASYWWGMGLDTCTEFHWWGLQNRELVFAPSTFSLLVSWVDSTWEEPQMQLPGCSLHGSSDHEQGLVCVQLRKWPQPSTLWWETGEVYN